MLDDIVSPDAALERYTRDLTAEARAGRLEPVRCREGEIDRVVDILLRQSKNNPALVGPAGVGKTAIAEGLAQRIAGGAVPLVLREARLLALDHVALLAGTMYRGQYEERLKSIVEGASADPNIILFIDELHNLIGQGTAMGAAMDAANMLKPALVRGEFRVIGATTQDEYDHWVRGDPALERRFQRVVVRELSADQTLDVLRSRKERLERHHNVAIADDALAASVALTDRFVTDRARPDRAIDALDEACAHTQAAAQYTTELESMIVERRELARLAEREQSAAPAGAARAAGERSTDRARTAGRESARDVDDDPLERLARDGFAMLERFGADLRAAFGTPGQPEPARAATTAEHTAPAAPPSAVEREMTTRPATLGVRTRLAQLEGELQRRLVEAGLVVRGHDVARVVALATGQDVQWGA